MNNEPYKYHPIPFLIEDRKVLVTPKALIQLALSNERKSPMTDAELSDLIEKYLYTYMKFNGLHISTDEALDDSVLSFSANHT